MILIDNVKLLKKQHSSVLDYMNAYAESADFSHVTCVEARNQETNLSVVNEGKTQFLHSQYNPTQEAERFVEGLGNISNYKHVLFFGVGLGYHIEVFLKKYSNMSYFMFEPNPGIFYRFLEERSLNDFTVKHLRGLGVNIENIDAFLAGFMDNLLEHVLLVVPPAYERVFAQETKLFYDKFKKRITDYKNSLAVNKGYEKLWVFNSIKNAPKVMSTSNIVKDKRVVFQDKPVLLVAAGPSLQDEIENIRLIKDQGTAYIFTVGSANKALLAKGIVPDAMTTYDPNPWNIKVFEDVIQEGRQDIPLIFGSSVGYETVAQYPGPQLHMITSQDTVSSYFLDPLDRSEIIADAPSIAVLTLQLLSKMKASPIILVGQNFGFRNNQYYSEGIQYQQRPNQLSQAEINQTVETESVEGGMILTTNSHNSSRLQMQSTIASLGLEGKVLNTTRGGAKIEGAKYVPFQEVMEKHLSNSRMVNPDWYKSEPTEYSQSYFAKRVDRMEDAHEEMNKLISKLAKLIKKMEDHTQRREAHVLENCFTKFDKLFNELIRNDFFCVFIKPMLRVQFELLGKTSPSILRETNIFVKGKKVVEHFGTYLLHCTEVHKLCMALWHEFKQKSESCFEEQRNSAKVGMSQ
ncbi:hypothetical protein ASG89_29060 [Paenibacillus sp. Soil766]|uniref:motility associated factor glycosyltransferase family protein n=1 Tax=Paenibacillus sp. Soil766 TaxID=1736404 RepID=UPI00070B5923|nr:6-hydroxymethylpterin diphosphokinase MptE-like protein [Paenibacillus sp. Soil766]KRE97955.1 hypothetical protein ASG89_29060 [Paenibacillus sp. Soil766]